MSLARVCEGLTCEGPMKCIDGVARMKEPGGRFKFKILGKLLNLCRPLIPHLKNGDN